MLSCVNICKTFDDGSSSLNVLNNVSLSVSPKEQVAILGSSGSGKSTLLHILGTLDFPTTGTVMYKQKDLFGISRKEQAKFRNQQLGFVYQFHHLLPEFDAIENISMPLLIAGESRAKASVKATNLLNLVGLKNRANHKPYQLSGGERQRVAIARAMVAQPSLMLADEPTGNLDKTTSDTIYDLLNDLRNESDTAFVVVTHDIELASRLDRVLSLKNGSLVSDLLGKP